MVADVPHVRDRLVRVRDSLGLKPAQVTVADSLTSAVATVFGSADLLLCSAEQAVELGLGWRPIGEIELLRGFDIAAGLGEDADALRTRLRSSIARCLGVPEPKEVR